MGRDEIAKEARLQSRQRNRNFLNIFGAARKKSEQDFDDTKDLPSLMRHLVILKAPGGSFWKHAMSLYEKANFIPISESDVRVTEDPAQANALRVIAREIGVDTEVVSYRDFSLSIMGG